MFNKITPEKVGYHSQDIINLVKELNSFHLNTHGILMLKGDDIFFETYYRPFNKDSLHRFYSETKSFISIAIGLLEEEGKLSISDPIVKFFPEYINENTHPYLLKQTIEDMLMMRTCVSHPTQWFYSPFNDRVAYYFDKKYSPVVRPSGLFFEYDSDGSQVLCALVEKLSGLSILDYLKVKMFNDMGTFKNAYMLKTPTGVSWGDSGLIATLRDQASFGRLVMNYGVYNGKRYINEQYVKTATSKLISNDETCFDSFSSKGYGYQIWHLDDDDFAFYGMGDQITLMFKKEDVLVAIHSSNQGNPLSRDIIYKKIREFVKNNGKCPLDDNPIEHQKLLKFASLQSLRHQDKGQIVKLEKYINGVTYIASENDLNIKEFSLTLDANSGTFCYINKTGKKEINFGRGKNIFEKFPEEGYSNLVGKEITKGYFYNTANSGRWLDDEKFIIECQIIDKYLGNLTIFICFKEDYAYIKMVKNAENFLREYFGTLLAYKKGN